jgi:hypothetical protein
MNDDELNSVTEIKMNQSKFELISNYYQFLETFIR